MREYAALLLQLLDSDLMPSSEVLAETRWQLGSHVIQHLAFEDRHLYAKLLRDKRPHVREIGHKHHRELTELFSTYSEHARHWTPSRIASDWNGFRTASREMTLAMFDRIDLEETELYPLVREADIDIASNAAPTTNWAREAFTIKDAITLRAGYSAS